MKQYKRLVTILFIALFGFNTNAQVAKNQVIMANAIANSSGITLQWPLRTFTGNYNIFKRSTLETMDWGNAIASVPSTATSFIDNSITAGKTAEYLIVATENGSNIALGYLWAGNKKREELFKGSVMLMIDSSLSDSLGFYTERLAQDLKLEGWQVHQLLADRLATPSQIKSKLKKHIKDNNLNLTTLFIIGHVPVPYSGDFSGNSAFRPPDGHVEGSGNHTGAWAADGFYGDLDFDWEDLFVNNTTGNRIANRNIVNDGKFDHSKFPSSLELEVGRVDLFDMPTFSKSEIQLLKDYFDRNHAWRTGQRAAINRAIVDNNFGGLNLASTAYHNFSAFFPLDSVKDGDYITEQSKGSYLWSFGCGAGSYTSCNGIGNTASFANNNVDNVFTILSGSFFGDWDVTNNFLRAPLCNQSLASFWGGIPKWYIHTMALGKHIGFGTKQTQNNTTFYFNGAFNLSENSVHIALMGDPTLTNSHLPQVKGTKALSANNKVELSWNKASGNNFDGYAVYRVDTVNKTYFRVNETPIVDTFYSDITNWFSGQYLYQVRTIKLEETGSGTYYNVGGTNNVAVNHTNNIPKLADNKSLIYPNPTLDGLINISSTSVKGLKVFNTNGQLLFEQGNGNQIDISTLKNGIYLLEITDLENEKMIYKVCKQ